MRRRFFALIALVLVLTSSGVIEAATPPRTALEAGLDPYGGNPAQHFTATGYFGKAQDSSGRWWLVDPAGNAFYASGVSVVTSSGFQSTDGSNPYRSAVLAKYGNNQAAWVNATRSRLQTWGFNTIGPYSDPIAGMPYLIDIGVLINLRNRLSSSRSTDTYPILFEDSTSPSGHNYDDEYRRYFYDVFDPSFDTYVPQVVQTEFNGKVSNKLDPNLIGYLVDNEVPLWTFRSSIASSPWHAGNTLADVFISLGPSTAGKQAWVNGLRSTYGTIGALNAAWGTSYGDFSDLLSVNAISNTKAQADKDAFLKRIVDKYFSTVKAAIRAQDSNHMYMCSRLIVRNLTNPGAVYDSAAQNCDVVTVNYYVFDNETGLSPTSEMNQVLGDAYRGAPLLVSEYSYAGHDALVENNLSGTNKNGAIATTQEERATMATMFKGNLLTSQHVVGDIWWDYVDPPPPYSVNGFENSNLGLVSVQDKPYLRFLWAVMSANRSVYAQRGLVAQAPAAAAFHAYRVIIPFSGRALPYANPPPPPPTTSLPPSSQVQTTVSSSTVTFSFNLANPATAVTLDIFDGTPSTTKGSSDLVTSINGGGLGAGRQTISWARNGAGSGTYLYLLTITTADGPIYINDRVVVP